jgi:carbonic anhydrase
LAVISIALAACSESGRDADRGAAPPHEQGSEAHEVHWGYEGEEGPEHWADLSEDFSLCRDGTEQSPIDLTGATPVDGVSLERRLGESVLTVNQRATVMDIVDNGHTVQVTNDVPMSLALDGKLFELVQYHFHAPSEHTMDGEHAPLEAHFVHKSAAGELAVVGILVEQGEYDVLWEPVLSALPDGPGDDRHLEGLDLDMSEFRRLPKHFYRYQGSLTTPPCSEGVSWVVMAGKRQISQEQMTEIRSHLHDNNRPVQPLNERTLQLVSAEDSED